MKEKPIFQQRADVIHVHEVILGQDMAGCAVLLITVTNRSDIVLWYGGTCHGPETETYDMSGPGWVCMTCRVYD